MKRFFYGAAVLHWLISFFTDRLIFDYQLWDPGSEYNLINLVLVIGSKLCFLALLLVIYQGLYRCIKSLRTNEKETLAYLRCAGIYFAVMLLFLILVWPGIWRLDEFSILTKATALQPHFWQHYLTSVFYILSLMLFPFPAGVVLVQIIVNALITGYIINNVRRLHQPGKWLFIMYIPFFFLPVINSNLYPIRMSVYAFVELFFIAMLYFKSRSSEEISKKDILILALLTGILVTWRTECIYYVAAAPILFITLYYKKTTRKKKWLFTGLAVFFALLFGLPQSLGNRIDSGEQYDITAVVLPLAPLVAEAVNDGETELLQELDPVVDTAFLYQEYQQGNSGINAFWSGNLVREGYSSEQYDAFKSAYYKLILKYPGVFLRERLDTMTGSTGLLGDSANMFTSDTPNYVQFRENYAFNRPLHAGLRARVVAFLECSRFTDYETAHPLHNVIYNFIPQIVILFTACVVLLIRKQWGYFFLTGAVAAKIPLIFLTAPSRLFMYYYSVYLIGSVLAVYLVFLCIIKRKETSIHE